MIEEWALQEMCGAKIRDGRRRKSLARICTRLANHANDAFSTACGNAVRQAAHRIFEHPESTVEKLLAGHLQRTAARCRAYPYVLAAQDTSVLDFTGARVARELGPVNDAAAARGLFVHSALALTPDGTPLGLLDLQFWVRDPQQPGKAKQRRTRLPDEKESRKWRTGLEAVERALPEGLRVLLIQDREADVFDFLSAPRRDTTDLLVRVCQPRAVLVPSPAGGASPQRTTLLEAAAAAPVVGFLSVRVGRKPGKAGEAGKPERWARLEVRSTPLLVQPPQRKGVRPVPQPVWVVQAREVLAPAGEERVEWVLVTTRPIADAQDAFLLVREYALRWRVERYHYTLKSGCRVERLQIDDRRSLEHALAIYGVVAWRLLHLTYMAREEPERPAEELLEAEEVQVLEQATKQPVPTAQAAVRAVARLGGYNGYRNGPEPGVKALWQGLRRLGAMVEGWRLARSAMTASAHPDL